MPKKLFVKGQSGNPGGRPNVSKEVRAWAQEVCEAYGRDDVLAIAQSGKSEEIRLKAWAMLFDRAYGKPMQQHEVTGADGKPIEFEPTGSLLSKLAALMAATEAQGGMGEAK